MEPGGRRAQEGFTAGRQRRMKVAAELVERLHRRRHEWSIAHWWLERGHWSAIITLCWYQQSYWFSHLCLNICKVTTNVVITFEWDSSVSSFGWLLQRYRWDSPNQINTLFFLVIFLIDFPFLSGEEAFERSADCGFFCVCVCVLLQILFMNKIDLFQDKILHSGRHLRSYLPQFKGRPDVSHFLWYVSPSHKPLWRAQTSHTVHDKSQVR